MASSVLNAAFSDAFQALRDGRLKTFIPFLCIFRLNGNPMDLRMHYQVAPLYSTVQPKETVFMFGRQLGKTTTLSTSAQLRAGLVAFYHVMLTEPRADQVQRFNNATFKPLLQSSPIRNQLITRVELEKMALKQFNNGSLVYMDYMFTSPDRIRGAANLATVMVDEAQDVEYEFLKVVGETTSASMNWGFHVYTGTPKTTDTTLALLWEQSSQSEWVIKCLHCGFFNVPNPEQHLLKMIGKTGPICAKCGKPIYPRDGGYVAAVPSRINRFAGYHVSQTIHPMHMYSAEKWNDLLYKVETYPTLTLYNEVFGWPYDAATSPLTLSDIRNAKLDPSLPVISRPEDFEQIAHRYRYVCIGVDWSGGGAVSDSYTAMAVLGLRGDTDVIECAYGRRFPKDTTPMEEADEILRWIQFTGADCFSFDNGGAGFLRMEIMKQKGLLNIPGLIVIPINYTRPRSGDIMRPNQAKREADLYWYTLDKSRSLAVVIQSIKQRKILLPDFKDDDEKAFQRDLLALREDPRKALGGETVILIVKKPGVPDDFAHAVNFGCSAIWDHFQAYPRLGQRYDSSILDVNPDGTPVMPDEIFGPRSDWDRFAEAVMNKVSVVEPTSLY